jgi:formate hydrogenlyase subunit 3/multisubunit Na+/H+ antiporter MnhD subunit
MTLLLLAVAILVASGVASLLANRSARLATGLGAGGAVAACAMALIPSARGLSGVLSSHQSVWNVPGGSFFVAIDPLSSFFLVPIFALSLLAAVYGSRYTLDTTRSVGRAWFWFNLLVAGMAMVVVARNAVLFLVAWEIMAMASFFLVTFEHDRPEVQSAGWTYIVATHLGTAFLMALFLLLGRESLDFDRFVVEFHPALIFVLAVVGFGTKAGLMPFHVWLPEAHPAAPTHVSALMSGVMIKTGIYGLLRVLSFLGPPPAWWGWTLVGVGLVSGVLGVLFALAQHDLKRLLAYSSVENVGIVSVGLGAGVLGVHYGSAALAVLGFGGGLLHLVNHTMFKGLLFLAAGSVAHAAHTLRLDHLGGLLRRTPWTGTAFLIGSAAIAGLPPLNGFVGEFIIYLGAYEAIRIGGDAATLGVATIGGLALIGGLSAACFARAFGTVFLGEPRSPEARLAHESSGWMRWPMVVLGAGCIAAGIGGAWVVGALGPVIGQVSGLSPSQVVSGLAPTAALLRTISILSAALIAAVLALAGLRRILLRRREVRAALTWDCGYAEPSPRMQYTASSFAQPLTGLFGFALRVRKLLNPPRGYFPTSASLETRVDDVARRGIYRPVFLCVGRAASRLRVIQHGRLNLYVLYIALTLAVLLVWKIL